MTMTKNTSTWPSFLHVHIMYTLGGSRNIYTLTFGELLMDQEAHSHGQHSTPVYLPRVD